MKNVTLRRFSMGDLGTFGTLEVDGLEFKTGELPWRDNKKMRSCVPAGTYLVEWDPSPKYGMKYELRDVPNRTTILIHAANYVGDESLGYAAQVDGCIALGYDHGDVTNKKSGVTQFGVKDSRRAVEDFEKHMKHQPFKLTIIDEYLEAGDPTDPNVA